MNQNQTNTMTVTAPDIVCGGCAGAIKKALGNINGVSDVEVNIETKRVTVRHTSETSREKIVEALDDAGFPSE
jgi:copper chaperone CopZ